MSVLHNVAHFIRWRLIALRYAGTLRNFAHLPVAGPTVRSKHASRVMQVGFDDGPALTAEELAEIRAIYQPRTAAVVPHASGHPFVNLFTAEDLTAGNAVFRCALAPAVLDVADDYFSGRFVLDSIQVLYSWPTQGGLLESQMWHKDYGDRKSLHWICYLNDVLSDAGGPFVFANRVDSKRIARSAFIRRIDDRQFARELGSGSVRRFLAPAGQSVFVDPAVCYHYGSRCQTPRLALFVTFNTQRPFVPPIPLVACNRDRILAAAQVTRPDLDEGYLRRLLQLRQPQGNPAGGTRAEYMNE